jgi:hypothetical protein
VSFQSSEEEDSGVLIGSLLRTVLIKYLSAPFWYCSRTVLIKYLSAPFWYCSRTILVLLLGLFVTPSLGLFVRSLLVVRWLVDRRVIKAQLHLGGVL